MTIFARRRLQAMLNEVSPLLNGQKRKDLLRRLNHRKDTDQALPAEMELALVWAVQTLGAIEVEPSWWGDDKRPDIVTGTMLPGEQVAIEIAATNDNSLSGEQVMDAIARQFGAVAERVCKGCGQFLRYRFGEASGYRDGTFFRHRLAPDGFQLPEDMAAQVTEWVRSGHSEATSLRLVGDGLDVTIERAGHKQTRFHNISSSMPAETHSPTDNPLYTLLRRKKRQLRAAPVGTTRIIFVADVGAALLNQIGRHGDRDRSRRRVSGSEIIWRFIADHKDGVDAVIVFSPVRDTGRFPGLGLPGERQSFWRVSYFAESENPRLSEALQRVADALPEPHYEGCQARSLFRQGAFSPSDRGQYLGMTITSKGKGQGTSVDFPARMLLDLLAGRLSPDQFNAMITNSSRNANPFKLWLDRGLTIGEAEMLPRSLDEDDDHIRLHLTDDPAARPFTLPEDC